MTEANAITCILKRRKEEGGGGEKGGEGDREKMSTDNFIAGKTVL